MAFKSRSTFVGHCKNMHNFDDGGEPDTPLPPHKVSFSLYSIKLMAYSHCRIRTRTRIPNPMDTLYYEELFTLVRIWTRIPVQIPESLLYPF